MQMSNLNLVEGEKFVSKVDEDNYTFNVKKYKLHYY